VFWLVGPYTVTSAPSAKLSPLAQTSSYATDLGILLGSVAVGTFV